MTVERLIARRYGALELKQSYQQGLLLGLLAAALLHVGLLWGLSVYGGLSEEPPVVNRLSRLLDEGRLRMAPPVRIEEELPPPPGEIPSGRTEDPTKGNRIVLVDDNVVLDEKLIPTNDERAERTGESAIPGGPPTGETPALWNDVGWVSPLPRIDEFTIMEREPRPLPNQPRPEYPDMARLMEVEGTVVLRILISDSGDVLDARPLNKEGTISPLLVEAAMQAVREWKFIPALQNNRSIPVWFNQAFKFKRR